MHREPALDPRHSFAEINATEIAAAQQIETIAAQLRSGELTIATAARLLAQQLPPQELPPQELTTHELTALEQRNAEQERISQQEIPQPAAQPLVHSPQPWNCQPIAASQASLEQVGTPKSVHEPTVIWEIECSSPIAAKLTRQLFQSGHFPNQLAKHALDAPRAASNSAAITSTRVQIQRPGVFRLAQLAEQLGWPPPAALVQHWQQQLASIRGQLTAQRWPLLFGPAEDIGITAEGQFVWDLLPARIAQSMLYLQPELFQLEASPSESLLTSWQPPPVENMQDDPAWLAGCLAIQQLLGQSATTDEERATQQPRSKHFSSPFTADTSQLQDANKGTSRRVNRPQRRRASRPTKAIAGLVGIGLIIAAVPVAKRLLPFSTPEQAQVATTRQPTTRQSTAGPGADFDADAELQPVNEPLETPIPELDAAELDAAELDAADWNTNDSDSLESDSLDSSGLTTTLLNWEQGWGLLDEQLSEFPELMPTDANEPEQSTEPEQLAEREPPAVSPETMPANAPAGGQPVNVSDLSFETARWETSWRLPAADAGGKKWLSVALLDRPAKVPSPQPADAGADAGQNAGKEIDLERAPLSFRWLTEISDDDQRSSRGLLEIQESDESPVRVRVRVDLRRGRQLELKVITAATLQPELGWRAVTHQGVIELSDSTAAAATEIEQSLSVTRAAYERAEESQQRSQLRARRRMLEDQQNLAKTWLERLAALRRLLARIERELQLQITIAEAPAVTPTTTP
ncbi:hypothetical protein SH139x_001254 [Planctomycetaceae bacterium SH139]